MITIICSDCEHEIEYDTSIDEAVPFTVECENCGCEIIVTSLDPLKYELFDEEK